MNPCEIFEDFLRKSHLKNYDGEYYLVFPFFRPHEDDSVEIRLYSKEGELYISDCGGSFRYLADRGVDREEYRERIDRIKRRFYLSEKDGELYLRFPSPDPSSAEIFFGYFIQGISAISCVDA